MQPDEHRRPAGRPSHPRVAGLVLVLGVVLLLVLLAAFSTFGGF